MTDRRLPFSHWLAALLLSSTWMACGGSSSPTCQPTTELCNGRDDSCDGRIDEGFDVGAACSNGVGACVRSGVKICSTSGATTECSAVAGSPAAESCNQLDDNCDGATDEGLAGCCVPATTRACGVDVGACQAGTETCSGSGAWGACLLAGVPVRLPGTVAESCNGIDDDCDGVTDQQDATGCTTYHADQDLDGSGAGAGACLCAPSGAFTSTTANDCDDSNAAVHPGAVEKCDGLDDDCDSQTDEGFGMGSSCGVGTGACARSGVTVCTADGSGAECNATPGAPAAETCNGIDDDCNGTTDEGLTSPACPNQTGVCAGSVQSCGGASNWLACSAASYGPNYQAVETTCDGRDNDCDGATDEGYSLGAACSVGTGACARTGVNVCLVDGTGATCSAVPGSPTAERCNGIDDDCNGVTDEGFSLGGACSVGTGACQRVGLNVCKLDGSGVQCSATVGSPSVETCNAIDDDCNGTTDEGLTPPHCASQTGVCAGSVQSCGGASGWLACSAASYGADYQAVEATCDGLDNDCDGLTDEGLPVGVACTAGIGACQRAGNFLCIAGEYRCSAVAGGASPEICLNGIDENCNGLTDEDPCSP